MKRFLLLWFVGASLIGVGLGSLNVPRLYPLMRRGVETSATITAFEPNNHRTVHYSFNVSGKVYSGSQEGGVDGEATGVSTISSKHPVFYLPDDPNISCIGDPAPMLKNEVIPICLAMLIFPPTILLISRGRYAAFRRWLKPDVHEGIDKS